MAEVDAITLTCASISTSLARNASIGPTHINGPRKKASLLVIRHVRDRLLARERAIRQMDFGRGGRVFK